MSYVTITAGFNASGKDAKLHINYLKSSQFNLKDLNKSSAPIDLDLVPATVASTQLRIYIIFINFNFI